MMINDIEGKVDVMDSGHESQNGSGSGRDGVIWMVLALTGIWI